MSNHFTGLSLGPPMGDARLDLCDLYAFQSPADGNRTVIILNANFNADALHPDAIYRLNIHRHAAFAEVSGWIMSPVLELCFQLLGVRDSDGRAIESCAGSIRKGDS